MKLRGYISLYLRLSLAAGVVLVLPAIVSVIALLSGKVPFVPLLLLAIVSGVLAGFIWGLILYPVALLIAATSSAHVWKLIGTYLFKRRIAWVSLLAVMLCTAMVIIVISVMGGWIEMFRSSFKGMSGDIVVQGNSLSGFPYYEEMIEQLKGVQDIEAATPVLRSFGLLNIDNQKPMGVQVYGFKIEDLPKINNFSESLWRQYQEPIESPDTMGKPPTESEKARRAEQQKRVVPSFALPLKPEAYRDRLPKSKFDESKRPGMIVGYGVVNIHRTSEGQWVGRDPFLYKLPVKLTVLSMSGGNFDIDLSNKSENRYWMVDFSRTKMWQYDQNCVYVPFDVLQKDLGLTGGDNEPARTTELHIKVKDGANLVAARKRVQDVVKNVLDKAPLTMLQTPRVQTWEEAQATYLGAVEHERLLLLFLFGIISLVAVFLIFCIFYMIVMEKTKDIGIIKSVGATDSGVAGIFLGYGAAIGTVGSLLGLLAAWLIVHNINYLHTKLGEVTAKFMGEGNGLQIWNPEVYLFDTIPNRINPTEATVIILVAICFSVLGALIPAWRAARMHPVEALRWE